MNRRHEADLSGFSPAELEIELRQVSQAIHAAGAPRGVARVGTEVAALREVAALAARRRAILAEVAHRKAALASWQAAQEQFDAITREDAEDVS